MDRKSKSGTAARKKLTDLVEVALSGDLPEKKRGKSENIEAFALKC